MDYESRKVKWYWLFLFTLYCGGVVYWLFQGNPFLYSRVELRSSLNVGESLHYLTIPTHPDGVKPGNPTFYARYNPERTGVDPMGTPRSKNYEEFEHFALDFGKDDVDVQNVTGDASGIFISGMKSAVFAFGLDGKLRWKYRFRESPSDHAVYPVLLDETSAYIVHPQGEVVCLDKETGSIRWLLNLDAEVAAMPLLWKKTLIVPLKRAAGVEMAAIERTNGHFHDDSGHFDIKPGFLLTEAPELESVIATIDNKVLSVDPEDWSVQWSMTLTDPIKGPPIVVGQDIFVATIAAKVTKIDGAHKGKLDWEADIVKPPAGAPSYLPVTGRLSILDTTGALSLIDAKTGKVFWRVPADNRNPLQDTWSARLKGKYIEEFKMDWLHKGWTVWTPCYDNSFCIFTPKGGLVARLHLGGRPLALPLPYGKRWVFLVQPKPGHYVLSHMVEDSEIKELKGKTGT